MRTCFFVLAFLACIGLAGSAWAIKPPTVKERQEKVSNPDQHKKTKWFGRESGRGCECGASKTDPSKCYYPKEGQYCCNPSTGDCHIVKPTKYNIPFKD